MEEEIVDGGTADSTEGAAESHDEIKLSKKEYDELVGVKATVGSLRRELKDLRKSKEEVSEAPKTEEFGLLQKTYLRSAGIVEEDEVALAKRIKKETGVDWDSIPDNKYFKLELESLRTEKQNAQATDVSGAGNVSGAGKNSPEYWIQRGMPPTAKDVPSRSDRVKIINAMMKNDRNRGGTFYNE